MRAFRCIDAALSANELAALRREFVESPLNAASTLAGTFRETRGFALTFTEAGLARVRDRFPALTPFLARALGQSALDALTPWYRRRDLQTPNAWYLNLLTLFDGGHVGRHVDGTLRGPSGVDDAVPKVVSVLYLEAPPALASTGALVLSRGTHAITELTPREGRLIHFDGRLDHQVTRVELAAPVDSARGEGKSTPARRSSLVLEQYRFAPEALARLPEFKIDSRAGFSAYLQSHQAAVRAIVGTPRTSTHGPESL